MSLVGPRPPLPTRSRATTPGSVQRLAVTPGITGPVAGQRPQHDRRLRHWLELDLEYARTWSLWLDLRILLKTIVVVILATRRPVARLRPESGSTRFRPTDMRRFVVGIRRDLRAREQRARAAVPTDPMPPDAKRRPPATPKIPVTMPDQHRGARRRDRRQSRRAPAPISLEQPIDPDAYICGPGDMFELNFWGQQNFRLKIAVDLEGRTFISKVGFVTVAGKTLTAVRKA